MLVPIGSLLALTTLEVVRTSQRRNAVLDQTDLARAAIGPSGLVTKLQNERIWAALASIGFDGQITIDVEGYDETRGQTDDALAAFRRHIAGTSGEVRAAFGPPLAGLDGLRELRAEIDANDEAHDVTNVAFAWDLFEGYSDLITPVLDAAQDVSGSFDDEELRIGLLLSDAVTRQLDTVQLALSQAIGDVLLSPGGIDRRDEILRLIDLYTDLVEQGDVMASAWGPYADVEGKEQSAELSRQVGDQVLFAIGANEVDIGLLLDTLSQPGDNPLYVFQASVQDLINQRADELEAAADRRLRIMTALAIVALVVGGAVIAAVARSITHPLRSLAEQANAVAHVRLPAAVDGVLAAPTGEDVVLPELAPITVPSHDEVADVADALSTLQRAALVLAIEQAVLRRHSTDALVSLGRRNQNLLDRQLELITQLEGDEADPDVLDSLFRLDHLATRMRRNAEGVMVLAGLDSPRHWPAPVALVDVIRSAIGEVEDYTRVVLHSVGPVMVAGHVAADLAHVLAELVENALVYSPPDHDVEILGRSDPLDRGYTVGVVDTGLGMPPAELAAANRRLAGTENYAVAPSKYLGHYVAGILARRHGMVLRLSPTDGGGTTATVHLPAHLLCETEATNEARTHEAPQTPGSKILRSGPAGPLGSDRRFPVLRRGQAVGARRRLEEAPEGGGGVGVGAGDGVGVVVEGGGDAAVVQPSGDGDEGDAGMQHLGGHEVAEVVEPERSQSGGAAVAEERFGDAVGFPSGVSAVVTEHEPTA
jgi:signal transduction histidine kinase